MLLLLLLLSLLLLLFRSGSVDPDDQQCVINRALLLTWPAAMHMYWNKTKRLHRKRAELPQYRFGTPIWREWALTSFPRTLLPLVLPRATREWLFSISLKWRACSQAVAVFIVVHDGCIVIIMSQSIPRVRIPPKAFVKCWHLLWLSTSEQEWIKLLKFSSVAKPSIPITFTRFFTNKRKKSLRF